METRRPRRRFAPCGRGLHEMSFENTYVSPGGSFECRACRAEASRRYRASLTDDYRYLTKARRRVAARRADPAQAETIRAQDRARYAADPEKFRSRQRARNVVPEPVYYHRRDDLLDDWVHLRAGGCDVVTGAARLGMKPATLRQALLRARRDGDPRALTVADRSGTIAQRVS